MSVTNGVIGKFESVTIRAVQSGHAINGAPTREIRATTPATHEISARALLDANSVIRAVTSNARNAFTAAWEMQPAWVGAKTIFAAAMTHAMAMFAAINSLPSRMATMGMKYKASVFLALSVLPVQYAFADPPASQQSVPVKGCDKNGVECVTGTACKPKYCKDAPKADQKEANHPKAPKAEK